MAIYISIEKVSETAEIAEFRFSSDGKRFGRLSLDKHSGESVLLEPEPNDETEFAFRRAARKIFLHWREGRLPDKTCWAA